MMPELLTKKLIKASEWIKEAGVEIDLWKYSSCRFRNILKILVRFTQKLRKVRNSKKKKNHYHQIPHNKDKINTPALLNLEKGFCE